MTVLAEMLMVVGAVVAVLAGVGIVRFTTSYARFHAAGKASPVAFLIAGVGAGLQLGWIGAGYIAIAAVAMVLTLPVGVHLLFRAVHRTTDGSHLTADELVGAEMDAGLRPRSTSRVNSRPPRSPS